MRFLPCPQHAKHSDSDNVWTTHAKIDQNKFTFPQILHLSSNRRVHNLTFYFQFTTPARELTHRMKFEHAERHEFRECHVSLLPEARETPKILPRKTQISGTPCFFTTLGQRNAKKQTQKDTNFGNAIILCYLGPENHQIQPQKTRILQKLHSLTPAKMPRKVFIFPEFRTSFEMHSLTPSTLTKQQLGNT